MREPLCIRGTVCQHVLALVIEALTLNRSIDWSSMDMELTGVGFIKLLTGMY